MDGKSFSSFTVKVTLLPSTAAGNSAEAMREGRQGTTEYARADREQGILQVRSTRRRAGAKLSGGESSPRDEKVARAK